MTMFTQFNYESPDDISVLISDDGSWPDMTTIDAETEVDACQRTSSFSSGKHSPAATLVHEPYHYTLLSDDMDGKPPISMQCVLTPPTPVAGPNLMGTFPLALKELTYDYSFDREPLDMPGSISLSVATYQPKWIHRKLKAQDGTDGRTSFLSNVIPRSWSKGDRVTSPVRPQLHETQRPSSAEEVASSPVSVIRTPKPKPKTVPTTHANLPAGTPLARLPSVSPSIASAVSFRSMPLAGPSSSKSQIIPKSILASSSASIQTKTSKHSRSGSSVKFAAAPTYFFHNAEFAYECEHEDGWHEYESEEGYFNDRDDSPPATPASTTPSYSSTHPLARSRKEAIRIRKNMSSNTNKVRQALTRLITTNRRTASRSQSISISGPYPLWKETDHDTASIRSGRSLPSSVRSAPMPSSRNYAMGTGREKVKALWERVFSFQLS